MDTQITPAPEATDAAETAHLVHVLPTAASELLATAAYYGWSGTVSTVSTRLPGESEDRPHLRVQADDGSGRILSQEYARNVLDERAAVISSRVPGAERCYAPMSVASQLEYIAQHDARKL